MLFAFSYVGLMLDVQECSNCRSPCKTIVRYDYFEMGRLLTLLEVILISCAPHGVLGVHFEDNNFTLDLLESSSKRKMKTKVKKKS